MGDRARVQFSERLYLLSKVEEAWWAQHMDTKEVDDEGEPLSPVSKLCKDITDGSYRYEFLAESKTDDALHPYLWIHSNDGDPDHVAQLVSCFFKELRAGQDNYFELGWSASAFPARPGEFGGGALTVTNDGIQYLSSWAWLSERKKEFDLCTQSARTRAAATSPSPQNAQRGHGSKRA
jgi:hypothetical protein